MPVDSEPGAVAISPDGTLAVVGTQTGLYLFSGVNTGTLTQVGSLYAPTYTSAGQTVTMGWISTLGISLDGKYVLAGDLYNYSLLVIPFSASGFAAAPAAVYGNPTGYTGAGYLAIPYNDQLIVH
jgi:hypothetical protein